jgi:PIN domain nuclease of toxin-antitoxin system
MRIIIDTHIFLWSLSEPQRIDKRRRGEIESRANIVYVSSISIAEIMIKASIGKLAVSFDPVKMVEACGFELLAFKGGDALLLKDMTFHHKDPFDRMIIAQGIANKFPIMTNDEKFKHYDCKLI